MKPHAGQPLATAGAPLGQSPVAMILVHGRNAAPANILSFVPAFGRSDITYLAPAAAGGTWYPLSFMAEKEKNEPGISSGLWVLDQLVQYVVRSGVGKDRIVLLGFSQGACLTSEFAASHADRYGGIVLYSGGLIGPPGTTWDYPGSFGGTPVFLGCSDVDAHVPKTRVDESAAVFQRMGATVTEKIYPGMGHLVNEEEIAFTRTLLDDISGDR
ncbi:MAG TPA: dienelactone hydrolase family protein [Gemmatimonadales bacterium]|nr:dienelactone hydrolase family protein [Gemmatimonadales bacterium]